MRNANMNRLRTLTLGLSMLLAVCFAASAGDDAERVVKDRKNFIPTRIHQVVKGTAIGVLLTDGQPILSMEGRSGPPDQLVFSSNGASYRWVYVPTMENPTITNLQVPVGENGAVQVYPALTMANPRSVVPWGVREPYSLVEIQVNSGMGSPRNDSFVASQFKVVEGTKQFPLQVGKVLAEVKQLYAERTKKNEADTEKAMTAAAKKALGDRKLTGPRERSDLMYVTWMPEVEQLRVHFLTKISDGAFTTMMGGGALIRDPELPVPPRAKTKAAPIKPQPYKVGTAVGIEFGVAYVVSKEGKVLHTETLPIESFTQQLQPPPGMRPGLPPGRPGLPPRLEVLPPPAIPGEKR
jgi:hypothetical protein